MSHVIGELVLYAGVVMLFEAVCVAVYGMARGAVRMIAGRRR